MKQANLKKRTAKLVAMLVRAAPGRDPANLKMTLLLLPVGSFAYSPACELSLVETLDEIISERFTENRGNAGFRFPMVSSTIVSQSSRRFQRFQSAFCGVLVQCRQIPGVILRTLFSGTVLGEEIQGKQSPASIRLFVIKQLDVQTAGFASGADGCGHGMVPFECW